MNVIPICRGTNDLAEACDALASGSFRIVAGATDLYASDTWLRAGALLDISRVDALREIEIGEALVRIGAAVTWTQIRRASLPPCMAALREAAATIGGVQIQNRGTVGGNICNASPAADGVLALMALEAEMEIVSTAGRRRVRLDAFLAQGSAERLGPHEILAAVLVPRRRNASSYFAKLGRRRDLAISVVSCAGLFEWTQTGTLAASRIFVGSASRIPVRLAQLDRRLAGTSPSDWPERSVGTEDTEPLSPIDDVRASAEYRRGAAGLLVDRVLRRASEDRRYV